MSIYNVSNAAQLQSALATALGGDRIILASGSYGMVTIQNRNYTSAVTLQTASTANRAHFDGLTIANSTNLTISGLDLGRALAPEESDATALNWVRNSKNIVMTGVKIHGSMDGNSANDGVGLIVRDTTSFVINSSTFEELHRGAIVQRGWIVNVNNNKFQKIRSDGIDVMATKSIYIGGNTFKDFEPIAGDHGDAIQFWNTNEKAGSVGITIRDNIMMQNSAGGVQGIFLADAGAYRYKNVDIRNNLIYSNDAYNGIFVSDADKVNVIGNTVVSQRGDTEKLWIYLTRNTGTVVTANISDQIVIDKNIDTAIVGGNGSLAQTPSLAGLFADLNTPEVVADLLTAGYGYVVPGSVQKVAGTTGTRTTVADVSTSLQVSATPLDLANVMESEPAPVIPVARTEMAGSAAFDPIASMPDFVSPMRSMTGFSTEWFVALP